MERIIVSIAPRVIDYLDSLIFELYKADYFSFLVTAEDYVSRIYESIPTSISYQKHKEVPKELNHYGEFYVSYQSNKRMSWYIFFSKRDNR